MWGKRDAIAEQPRPMLHWHPIALHSESVSDPGRCVTLSGEQDRFGDRFAHVHYQSAEVDHAARGFARELFDRFAAESGGTRGFRHLRFGRTT